MGHRFLGILNPYIGCRSLGERVGTSDMKRLGARKGLSIGIKIFGIATSLLGLLILVAQVSAHRLKQVNEEIEVLAEYVIPITDQVAQIDVHVLEQELHFERIQKIYEIEPLDEVALRQEMAMFEHRGKLVDQELATVIAQTETALAETSIPTHQQVWSQIGPRLGDIEVEHQQFHDHALELFQLLETAQWEEAHALEDKLIQEEEDFNQRVNDVFLQLEAFTVESAQAGQQHQQLVLSFSIFISAIATLFGLFYASVLTLGLVRPVRRLNRVLQSVCQGNLDPQLSLTSGGEIGTLEQSFNGMLGELRQKATLEETFGKYVDPRIIKNLMDDSAVSPAQGERQVMTVFFAHVTGIDPLIEQLLPEQLVQVTNAYLTRISSPISDYSGVIDKFIGTIIMGFWGPPFTSAQAHPQLACEAALSQREQLEGLGQHLRDLVGDQIEIPPLSLTVGVATGPLVVGNMGSESAKSYTVMGDTVNLASRLKGASKQYGVSILITDETQRQLDSTFATRELDRIQVVGKQDAVTVYELVGRTDSLSDERVTGYEYFDKGLFYYRLKEWAQAQTYFMSCLQHLPQDRPAQLFLDRITRLQPSDLPADWDGSWRLTQK